MKTTLKYKIKLLREEFRWQMLFIPYYLIRDNVSDYFYFKKIDKELEELYGTQDNV